MQSVRRDFIVPVNKERREMVGNIILYFSTLASAFRFKAPLPPYLPPAEKARQQLVSGYFYGGCYAVCDAHVYVGDSHPESGRCEEPRD